MGPKNDELIERLNEIYRSRVLPHYESHPEFRNFPRDRAPESVLHYCELLVQACGEKPGLRVMDLGASFSTFAVLVRHLGADVHVVDLYGRLVEFASERYPRVFVDRMLGFFTGLGIQAHEFDVERARFPFESDSFDAITCFQTVEHFHGSPQPMFREVHRILKPSGVFIVATPNAVNLRKRWSVLRGRTNYYDFEEYWRSTTYLGHVREPTLAELHRYLERSGFTVDRSTGRNFMGIGGLVQSRSLGRRLLGRLAGSSALRALLEAVPTLCSDLHVVGRKPSSARDVDSGPRPGVS